MREGSAGERLDKLVRSHLDLFLGGFRAVGFLARHDAVEIL
jgi:hypothetical protein